MPVRQKMRWLSDAARVVLGKGRPRLRPPTIKVARGLYWTCSKPSASAETYGEQQIITKNFRIFSQFSSAESQFIPVPMIQCSPPSTELTVCAVEYRSGTTRPGMFVYCDGPCIINNIKIIKNNGVKRCWMSGMSDARGRELRQRLKKKKGAPSALHRNAGTGSSLVRKNSATKLQAQVRGMQVRQRVKRGKI